MARVGLGHLPGATITDLRALIEQGLTPAAIAWGLDRLVAERELQTGAHRTELVWTGPEAPGPASRDTSVVVREMLSGAERSVLLSTYAIFRGAPVFKVLADRMAALPELSVRMFVNISRPSGSQATEAQLLRAFAEKFVTDDWPAGARLPELFYDPRALSALPGPKAFSTLVDDPALARALRDQFESLVEARQLLRVPSLQH